VRDKPQLPVLFDPQPVELVVVERPQLDEEQEREEFLAAIEAAKDDDTELTTESRE
jgi:hypothetical protein